MSTSAAMPAMADDLDSAMRAAVDYSPLLTSARSRVDGCAAEVTIARADGSPTVDGTLRYSKELGQNNQSGDGLSVNTSVNVPLFRGGSVRNGIKATEAQCDASSASIGEVESEVTLMVARAYAEVIANRRIVALNKETAASLSVMLKGVRERLQARDLTRTDVDQAQSRLSLARGRLEASLATLEASEVEFERLTGKRPGQLAPFPLVLGIPVSPDAAVAVAVGENPGIIAARSEAQATRFSLRSAKGDLLPQVFATASSNYGPATPAGTSTNRFEFGTTVGVGMRVSLFAGGRLNAKVRAASARVTQAEQQMINLERSVSARTQAAYAEWQASKALVEASRQAVAANESALNGVRMENAVGTRTILEILNAEQELQDAQIQLANAEKDYAVASVSILSAMGKARPGQIELSQSLASAPSSAPPPLAPPLLAAASIATAHEPTGSLAEKPATPPSDSTHTRAIAAQVPKALTSFPPAAWAVQIGAYENLKAAKSQWQKVSAIFSKASAGKHRFAPAAFRVNSEGKTLFRLAAVGDQDWAHAQAACLAIKEKGQACLVKRANLLGEAVWSAPVTFAK
jgi:outer membrane protein